MNDLKRGGPATCPRPCSACDGDEHHWIAVCPNPDDPDDDELQHDAHKSHGLLAWYGCKHCEAWVEDVEEEELIDW